MKAMTDSFIKLTPMFPIVQTVKDVLHETVLKVQFRKKSLKTSKPNYYYFQISHYEND